MSRSTKKGPYIDDKLVIKVQKQKDTNDSKPIKTYARRSQIAPLFVGHTIAVYNGRKFIEVYITENMVGHRLGEFAPTRAFRSHGKITKRIEAKT